MPKTQLVVILAAFILFAPLFSEALAAERPTTLLLLPPDAETTLALSAAPEHLRAGAAVYLYGPTGYRLTRPGTNGFICMVNRDGNQAGDNIIKPTCWDPEGGRTIVPVMLRVGELIARSASAEAIKAEIDAGFASGKFSSPRKAGIAYMLAGDMVFDPAAQTIVRPQNPAHYMIYAPGVTNADIGLTGRFPGETYAPANVYSGYSGGTRTAYIIVMAMPAMAR